MKVFKDEKDEQFPIVMNLENGTGRHCLTTNAALELIKKLSELVEEKLKSPNTTKVQIVELVSRLEDAVAESNLTESSRLVTKLKYSAQQL